MLCCPNWHFAFAPCEPVGSSPAPVRADGRELSAILANRAVRTVFQPIVALEDGRILGYEALTRGPAGSPLESPSSLFETARQEGRLWELDSLCRLRALETIATLPTEHRFFLNIDPLVLNDPQFRSGFTRKYLNQFRIDPSRIVFELTEHNRLPDSRLFLEALGHYRQQGYQLAIDDAGTGYSGLKLIADLHPQFLKLDMDLIRGIGQDSLKQALVRAMADLCHKVGIQSIAEGIETAEELTMVRELGVQYGQGFLLGRPVDHCAEVSASALTCIQQYRPQPVPSSGGQEQAAVNVGTICRDTPLLPPTALCRDAFVLFESQPELYCLPVVESGTIAGLLTRHNFYARLGTQFGYDLYIKRPVTLLMDGEPLIVDAGSSIESVARQAMQRSHDRLYNSILVERSGRYLGLVSVKDLLEATMDIRVAQARHLNPLTGLPGNVLIQQHLQECLNRQRDAFVLYLDIDNFKAYNDRFGFENGDQVILFLAGILQAALEDCPGTRFAGHIGGDDFIATVNHPLVDPEVLCRTILRHFDEGIRQFLPAEQQQVGGYEGHDRAGNAVWFAFPSLSIAVVRAMDHDFPDPVALSEHATRVKHTCKAIAGSCFLVD